MVEFMSFPTEENKEGLTLDVDVVANAGSFSITGVNNKCLKVKLKAVPEKGKANKELIKEFKRMFGSGVEIVSGKFSNKKKILLRGNPKQISRKIKETINSL